MRSVAVEYTGEKVAFTVPGEPIPWQRPRLALRKGKVVGYSAKESEAYRLMVGAHARRAMMSVGMQHFPIRTPVSVTVIARRSSKNVADVDNLAKQALDALVYVHLLDDDRRVYRLEAIKCDGDLGDEEPGMDIEVEKIILGTFTTWNGRQA